MRSIITGRCVRRTTPAPQEPIAAWAARVVADPQAHHATEREAALIGALAAQLPGGAR